MSRKRPSNADIGFRPYIMPARSSKRKRKISRPLQTEHGTRRRFRIIKHLASAKTWLLETLAFAHVEGFLSRLRQSITTSNRTYHFSFVRITTTLRSVHAWQCASSSLSIMRFVSLARRDGWIPCATLMQLLFGEIAESRKTRLLQNANGHPRAFFPCESLH